MGQASSENTQLIQDLVSVSLLWAHCGKLQDLQVCGLERQAVASRSVQVPIQLADSLCQSLLRIVGTLVGLRIILSHKGSGVEALLPARTL